ncbi:filamentous hemagglutinin N-terminal domain-containing protein [Dechloromonas sp. TW-R-39-2]|uniref:two-partner secretion domain-containing protein n=1 Tax=Dechloromonas sp. TW-R-39-2 TaxID=2654218 RepID=UPI00193E7451|nr:filamentous hemagglutinin N-terminal domain-containing protein [Dechloromonas sp. TW-R-39-2]
MLTAKYLKLPLLLSLALTFEYGHAQSTPFSGLVSPTVMGQGSMQVSTNGNTRTLTTAPGTIINWQQFSIAAGETVHFAQASAGSAVLNRVTGTNATSQIRGTLTSNGVVFLINPSGIIFHNGSLVSTASFIASTQDITDSDWRTGTYRFAGPAVRPNGQTKPITVHPGAQIIATEALNGNIWLIGGYITIGDQLGGSNSTNPVTLTTGSNGTLILAAGSRVTIEPGSAPNDTRVKTETDIDGTETGYMIWNNRQNAQSNINLTPGAVVLAESNSLAGLNDNNFIHGTVYRSTGTNAILETDTIRIAPLPGVPNYNGGSSGLSGSSGSGTSTTPGWSSAEFNSSYVGNRPLLESTVGGNQRPVEQYTQVGITDSLYTGCGPSCQFGMTNPWRPTSDYLAFEYSGRPPLKASYSFLKADDIKSPASLSLSIAPGESPYLVNSTTVVTANGAINLPENTVVRIEYATTAPQPKLGIWERLIRPFTQSSGFTVENGEMDPGVRG